MTSSLFSPESLLRLVLDARQTESFRRSSTKHTFEVPEDGVRITYYRSPDGRILIDAIAPIPSSFPYL